MVSTKRVKVGEIDVPDNALERLAQLVDQAVKERREVGARKLATFIEGALGHIDQLGAAGCSNTEILEVLQKVVPSLTMNALKYHLVRLRGPMIPRSFRPSDVLAVKAASVVGPARQAPDRAYARLRSSDANKAFLDAAKETAEQTRARVHEGTLARFSEPAVAPPPGGSGSEPTWLASRLEPTLLPSGLKVEGDFRAAANPAAVKRDRLVVEKGTTAARLRRTKERANAEAAAAQSPIALTPGDKPAG
jgi:hypothetical protein